MPGRLVERTDGRPGRIHPLGPARTTIGRGDDNDLVIPDDFVSTHHAEVRWDGTAYVLHDCGSTNGTRLNGERLTTPQALQSGDRIELPGQPGVTLFFADSTRTVELPVDDEPTATADTRLDPDTAELWVRGQRVHVTAKEYRALALLFERGGALVRKADLAAQVWPEFDGVVGDANVEQLIARLRRKLDGRGTQPPMLLTVRGLGYRLLLP